MSGDVWPERPPCTPEDARRSPAARRALDEFYARDLPEEERFAFLEHLGEHDERQRLRERRRRLEEEAALLRGAADLRDGSAGMRVRVDAVIADLVEQLGGAFRREAA